jgi:hypothetical protein
MCCRHVFIRSATAVSGILAAENSCSVSRSLHTSIIEGATLNNLASLKVVKMLRVAPLASTHSDSEGRFVFSDVEPGLYQLETCIDGWESTIRAVRVVTDAEANKVVILLGVSL